MKKKLIVLSIVLCSAMILASCSSGPAEPKQAPTPEKTSDAYTLSALFEDNKDEAEKSIVGKIVEVTGTFEKVASTGDIYLDRESVMGYIMCKMSSADQSDLSDLEKGDRIKIVGMVKGELGHIQMEECWYLGKAESK